MGDYKMHSPSEIKETLLRGSGEYAQEMIYQTVLLILEKHGMEYNSRTNTTSFRGPMNLGEFKSLMMDLTKLVYGVAKK